MKKKVLIEGMTCNHCVKHIAEALNEIDGISNVSVKLEEKYALLDAESNDLDEAIKFAVNEAGYEVVGIETI